MSDAPTPRETRRRLGNGIQALESCVTALYVALALRERTYEELLAYALALGGDVDTIAAMAGAGPSPSALRAACAATSGANCAASALASSADGSN